MNSAVRTPLGQTAPIGWWDSAGLEVLPTAAYVCDVDGFIVGFNSRARGLWGRAPRMGEKAEQYCGSYRLYLPDGRLLPHALCPMADALKHGASVRDQEILIERPNGDRITALVNIDALRDETGTVTGAINCFLDITARKRLEQELRSSQNDLEDFFDNGVVALHWVNRDGIIMRANQAELDLLGYSREEYIGHGIAEFHADRETIEDILARLSRGEKLDKCPARLRTRNGDIRHVLISSNVCFREGEFIHTRCFTVDVTERHAAEVALRDNERRFRELLHSLPAAVYTTDREGRITFYNEAAAEFWGHRPPLGESQWCGSWRLYRLDGSVLSHDECPMAQALREGRPVRNVEAVAERPDGTRINFMPYPTPLHDAAGEMIGAVNMLIDIGYVKEAERRQQLLMNELNHRVKNTLTTVQSIARQTFRGRAEAGAYTSFESRLIALARTHDVLTRESWAGADMCDVITQAVAFVSGAEDRIEASGPPLWLPPKSVVSLAMAVHELCTNALKYGALSHPSGHVSVRWQTARSGVRLRWEESGGPPVQAPTKRGFGTRLLERGLAHELKAVVHLAYPPSGVTCDIDFCVSA